MTPLVDVAGTWGWQAAWRRRTSLFQQRIRSEGFEQFRVNGSLFHWSTDVNGIKFYRRLLPQRMRSDTRDWFSGAYGLCSHIYGRLPSSMTVVLGHSHALSLILAACALGLKIRVLIDISGPVRGEFLRVDEGLLRELLIDDEAFESLSDNDRRRSCPAPW